MKSGADRGDEVTASGEKSLAVGGNLGNAVIGDNPTLIVQHLRPRVRRSTVLTGLAVLAVGGAVTGLLVFGDGKPATVSVGSVWPARNAGCDLTSRVAMPRGGPEVGAVDLGFENDPRNAAAAMGAASWLAGALTVSVSAVDAPVTLTRLQPVIKRVDTPPYAWTLSRPEGCGGPSLPVWPELDLDRARLTAPVEGGRWVEVGTAPDGITGTLVEKGQSKLIILKVTSCKASYEWSLDVGYLVDGVERTTSLGPFRSAGTLDGVPGYQIKVRTDGPGRLVVPAEELTDPNGACGAAS
ncbi:hypothetical protein [Kitasatospora albolonga]|uniref:hypothetical protein n=1 Tax=Kitasatospora albolonga TaxID=68173 RepID=UPI0035E8CE74